MVARRKLSALNCRNISSSAIAGRQLFFLDREDFARLQLDIVNDADAPTDIGELHVR